MNPRLQGAVARADRTVVTAGRAEVRASDILLGIVDDERHRGRHTDFVMAWLERRGIDLDEFRRRIEVTRTAPDVALALPEIPLPKRRPARRRPRRPDGVELAANPLGRDPWSRRPWGSAFARTRDERHLKVDGCVWFFTIDADGYYVRTTDGRPLGYRWRLEPKPSRRPLRGFMEVLPMPPVEMADWPDRRYLPDD